MSLAMAHLAANASQLRTGGEHGFCEAMTEAHGGSTETWFRTWTEARKAYLAMGWETAVANLLSGLHSGDDDERRWATEQWLRHMPRPIVADEGARQRYDAEAESWAEDHSDG